MGNRLSFKRLQINKYRSVFIGVAVVTGVLAVATVICLIVRWCIKNNCCENCCDDSFDDITDEEDDEPVLYENAKSTGSSSDENGCRYTSDKDFV